MESSSLIVGKPAHSMSHFQPQTVAPSLVGKNQAIELLHLSEVSIDDYKTKKLLTMAIYSEFSA